jgi:hypothetical protein
VRLNGRKAILLHLGLSPNGHGQWHVIRDRFASVIYRDPSSGHVWALSESLDAADSLRCACAPHMPGLVKENLGPKQDPDGD